MEEGYSICFNEWALDKEIKNELGLLLIISSLCAEKGYCFASNKYFSQLFDIPEQTISRKIKLLENKKYITIEYKKRGCEIIGRNIRLTKLLNDDKQKCVSTINKNVKENNININNTSNNNIKEIIDYLNTKLDTNYKYTTKQTQSMINARLKEGFTVDDFKKVIDKKYNEWLNTEFEQYLTPQTLFSTKFEKYLNQKTKQEVNPYEGVRVL